MNIISLHNKQNEMAGCQKSSKLIKLATYIEMYLVNITTTKDRNSFKEGKAEGVLLYVKNEINSFEYSELNILKSESVWCRV